MGQNTYETAGCINAKEQGTTAPVLYDIDLLLET